MTLSLFNTLTRRKEKFTPLDDDQVGLYTCGPTVYNYPHIGNMRMYIFEDILKRTLQLNGYAVKHVMNITDVGHLTSDEDTGEDKIDREAKKSGKNPLEIARFFTEIFKKNLRELNIIEPDIWCNATDHIKEQIELIKQLEARGFIYDTPEAVYFDVSKFSDYTKLSGQELSEKIIGARDEVEIETNKKNPHDFVLWFKCVGKYKDHILRWDSPWGVGFPGWHIECSAMSMKYLDEAFDIHCGGVDHIAVHHTNEIAQSEGATGKQFVKYWLHGEFLTIDEKRMGKSEGNFLTLDDIIKKGFHPLSYRYLMLLNHYRSKMSFSFDALTAAQNALFNVYYQLAKMEDGGEVVSHYLQRFTEAVNDDLNTPQALGIAHEMLADGAIADSDKRATFEKFDEIFGLKIKETIQTINDIPDDVRAKTRERDEHRAKQQWREADALRAEIESRGYRIEDYEDRSTVVLKNIYYENFCD